MVAMSWVGLFTALHFHDFFRFRFLQRIDSVLAGYRSSVGNPDWIGGVRAEPPVFGLVELLTASRFILDNIPVMQFCAVAVEVMICAIFLPDHCSHLLLPLIALKTIHSKRKKS